MVKPIHIFQFITNPVCAYYRFDIPAKYLCLSPEFKVTAFRKLDTDVFRRLINEADILIIQRLPLSPQLARIIEKLNERGKLVIYEIDDDLFNLPADSGYLTKAPPDYKKRLAEAVKSCQAVQCSTTKLAEVLSGFHNEIVVLENQLGDISTLKNVKKNPSDKVVIGYAAGENHKEDWAQVRDTFNLAIAEIEKNSVDIEICIIGDRVIYDTICSQNKCFLPLLARNDYKKALQYFDISLIPLQDTQFNHSKSDVKFLESAANNCAVLASHIVNGKSVKHGETGLVYRNMEEFKNQLTELVLNRGLAGSLAQNAFGHVKQSRVMKEHVHKWKSTYWGWFKRKNELIIGSPKVKKC